MTKGSSNYEKVRRILKQRLNEPSVRLKGQYSIRLYQWTKQYLAVGYKRISITTFRKILGLEDIQDNSGRVVRQAPLERKRLTIGAVDGVEGFRRLVADSPSGRREFSDSIDGKVGQARKHRAQIVAN
jgi:Initiator Replication protein